ncbi:unnamed protein product, partial [Owenia fusiformis]
LSIGNSSEMENITFNQSSVIFINNGTDENISLNFTNISQSQYTTNSDEDNWLKVFQFVLEVLSYIVIGLGLIGNTLAFLVFSKEKVLNTRVFLLKTLTITDSTFLLLMFLFVMLLNQWEEFIKLGAVQDHIATLYDVQTPIVSTAGTLTTWMVVLVTIDRYIHITNPLGATTLLTVKRMKWTVGSLVVGACLYNVPRFFKWAYLLLASDTCLLQCNPSYNLIYQVILNA